MRTMATPDVPATTYTESGDIEVPASSRPVIYGLNCTISSGHWLTTTAAERLLRSGGNSFDAVAAANFAAAVVEPTSSFSLGAECVILLRPAGRKETVSLCGQGGAAGLASPSYFAERGLDVIPTGPGDGAPLSFTTPGMVASTLRLLDDYGTKRLAEVLAPAIEYARDGIVSYEYMTSRLTAPGLEQFKRFGSGAGDIFYPDSKPVQPGRVLRQPALAAVLQALADADIAADRSAGIKSARALFYQGAIAERIAAASRAVGGVLSLHDLNTFVEEYETPASTSFAGFTIECQGFWSQAPVALQTLNILENFDLKSLGFNTPEYIHIVTEALKLAFADREAYYADPKFSDVPAEALLSKAYAKQRAAAIDRNRAAPGMPPAGDVVGHPKGTFEEGRYGRAEAAGPETGTTHISVVDTQGNIVVSTPSGGAFGKSVFFDDLGFTLSTRSEMLNLDRNHPNCVAPGKRPRTTLVNYIATNEAGDQVTFGCPGGDGQVQANVQILLNTLVWALNPQQAVEAPRFASMSMPNSFYPHSYFPARLALEAGFSEATAEQLKERGHEIVRAATCGMGAVVTTIDSRSGVRATSSDTRRSCHATGW